MPHTRVLHSLAIRMLTHFVYADHSAEAAEDRLPANVATQKRLKGRKNVGDLTAECPPPGHRLGSTSVSWAGRRRGEVGQLQMRSPVLTRLSGRRIASPLLKCQRANPSVPKDQRDIKQFATR